MHLLIDGQALQTSSSRHRGIGRYSSNLLRALAVARPTWRIEIVQNSSLKPISADDLSGLPILSFHPPMRSHMQQRELNERYYADWLTAQGADGVLVLSHCEGWDALVPAFCGSRPHVFGIAYDFIPLLYPEHYLTDFHIARWYAHRFRQLLQSDALMAISASTANDVRALVGSEAPFVVNIGGAVDPLFVPLAPVELAARSPEIRKRFGLQREFLLYIGAPDYRKNLQGAIRAFATLPPQWRTAIDLAVVCRMTPAQQATFAEMARQCGVASSVRFITSAEDEDLQLLYQICRLFFFPSLYEGMGLPVLEALSCGAPVVTSNWSSLPEYAGPHSWMGNPTSPQEMAQLLQQALAEPRDARRQERLAFARTFSWRQTAERVCVTMEHSMTRSSNSVRRRPRLAWVMPFTHDASDMVEHVSELLPHLADHFDMELVSVAGAWEASEKLSRHYLILTAGEVRARHAAMPYDMFLYQLSSPPSHLVVLDLLWQFPGLAVLHDCSALIIEDLLRSPVLGVPVHGTETPQQLCSARNISVVCLPKATTDAAKPALVHEQAIAYISWINRAIERSRKSDRLWLGFALRSLADCTDPIEAVIDSWASLRARGQQQFNRRRSRHLTPDAVVPAA